MNLLVDLDAGIEVIDRQLVVAHVVVDNTSSDKDRTVVLDLAQDLREALESVLELTNPMVHQAQVEAGADKSILKMQRLLVGVNRFLVELFKPGGIDIFPASP